MAQTSYALSFICAIRSGVFATCERLGVPVLLHGGINWWKGVPYDIGHPRYVDAMANAFPNLKIVVLHAFWPWVTAW